MEPSFQVLWLSLCCSCHYWFLFVFSKGIYGTLHITRGCILSLSCTNSRSILYFEILYWSLIEKYNVFAFPKTTMRSEKANKQTKRSKLKLLKLVAVKVCTMQKQKTGIIGELTDRVRHVQRSTTPPLHRSLAPPPPLRKWPQQGESRRWGFEDGVVRGA